MIEIVRNVNITKPCGWRKIKWTIKKKPKTIREDVKCIDCKYYEGENWKPWWSERYCHHPKIFRTGLIDTTRHYQRFRKEIRNKIKKS